MRWGTKPGNGVSYLETPFPIIFMPPNTKTLGQELRERRTALGMTMDDLARAARVSTRHISALEKNDYHVFPAKVYAQGTVRRLARIFSAEDGVLLISMLDREWPREKSGSAGQRIILPSAPRRLPQFFHISRKIEALVAGMFFALLLGFLGWRLFIFTAPPVLIITNPAPNSRITTPAATITGRTEKESRLTVNGREINIDERGAFREDIELPLGTNNLQFISESRFGKTSTETRFVLVE